MEALLVIGAVALAVYLEQKYLEPEPDPGNGAPISDPGLFKPLGPPNGGPVSDPGLFKPLGPPNKDPTGPPTGPPPPPHPPVLTDPFKTLLPGGKTYCIPAEVDEQASLKRVDGNVTLFWDVPQTIPKDGGCNIPPSGIMFVGAFEQGTMTKGNWAGKIFNNGTYGCPIAMIATKDDPDALHTHLCDPATIPPPQ